LTDLSSNPVYLNKKSGKTITEVNYYPSQLFVPNDTVSPTLNKFYEQATTINLEGVDMSKLDESKVMLGQINGGLNAQRLVNRWDYVDPRISQNVEHIIMNIKDVNGNDRSLFQCGISTRNELRNYVEMNNC
jgi:hypothetical protein